MRRKGVQLPGPGQYNSEDLVKRMHRKVWGKQGVFGSTERRFAQITRFVNYLLQEQKTPGPGFYNPAQAEEEPEYKRLAGQNAIFMPPSKISKKRPDVSPDIGQYDASLHTIQSNLNKLKEKCQRIDYLKRQEVQF